MNQTGRLTARDRHHSQRESRRYKRHESPLHPVPSDWMTLFHERTNLPTTRKDLHEQCWFAFHSPTICLIRQRNFRKETRSKPHNVLVARPPGTRQNVFFDADNKDQTLSGSLFAQKLPNRLPGIWGTQRIQGTADGFDQNRTAVQPRSQEWLCRGNKCVRFARIRSSRISGGVVGRMVSNDWPLKAGQKG